MGKEHQLQFDRIAYFLWNVSLLCHVKVEAIQSMMKVIDPSSLISLHSLQVWNVLTSEVIDVMLVS